MKKWIRKAAVGLCLLCIVTAFVACKNEPDVEVTPTDPPVETFCLAEDGVCAYRIIRSDYSSGTVTKLSAKFRTALAGVLGEGSTVDIKTDWEDKDDNAAIKEILIGETNRPESIAAQEECTKNTYIIRHVGNKIVITGGSEDALSAAIADFLENYCGYKSASDYTVSKTIVLEKGLNKMMVLDSTINIALYVTDDAVSYGDALFGALHNAYPRLTRFDQSAKPKDVFDNTKYAIVVVAGVESVQASFSASLKTYLEKGGKVLTLGGPALNTVLYEQNGEWVTKDEYLLRAIEELDEEDKEYFFDTESATAVAGLGRSSDTMGNPVHKTVDDYGLEGSEKQMMYEVENLNSWDYFRIPVRVQGKDRNTLCFWAKGDDHTGAIYLEAQESNGSRWITSVTLTEEWQYYVVRNTDFTWYHDGGSKESDTLNLSNTAYFGFGFAQSRAPVAIGHHSFCLASPCLCTYNSEDFESSADITLEGFSPLYELYPITNAATLKAGENQQFVQNRTYCVASEAVSCSPGRQGTGYNKGRTSRFVPLIEIQDAKGLHSGYAAWMNIFSSTTDKNGKYEGSALACFGAQSNDFYDANGIAAVVDTVKALALPALLVEGGTEEYTYVKADTQKIKAGATYVAYKNSDGEKIETTVSLYAGDRQLATYTGSTSVANSLKQLSHSMQTVSGDYALEAYPDRAVVELKINGTVVDRMEHTVSFWEAKPESERKYVTKEDGYFKRDGEIIYFFGVNYMPSSGVSESDGALFEYYVSSAAYDPDVIEKDLAHIQDIGMNAVSVFVYYNTVMESNDILDLIRRCENRGIYVDLSLRPKVYPLSSSFNLNESKVLIEKLHFYENDNIIAYDIAWEPRIGSYDDDRYVGRKHWDADWRKWIQTQYGSIEAAEALWGKKAPRDGSGNVIGLTDAMLNSTSSSDTKIVAAYLRFLDDQIAQELAAGLNELRKIDPNHLFSFRMSMSGSAMETAGYKPSTMCFDFQSLASTLDIMEPEGYALNPSNDAALQILFANAYSRYLAPDTPVVWKEFGRHVWNGSNFSTSMDTKNASADYYRYTLSRCLAAYTNGMFCWYYAGGFRIGENSDYGILNPDGSDRPVTELLREYAPQFIALGERPEADTVITVERDDAARGTFAMYEAAKNQMQEAYDEGKTIAFINRRQSNPDDVIYADELTKASVGNTATTGTYPLKYVNGMVKNAEVVEVEGKKVLRLTVTNTQKATWRKGTVSVVSVSGSTITVNATVPTELGAMEDAVIDIPYTKGGMLNLRFSVGGVVFGNLYSATIQ